MIGRRRLDVPAQMHSRKKADGLLRRKKAVKERASELTYVIKKRDVLLFILPYSLPCGPPGGMACCF